MRRRHQVRDAIFEHAHGAEQWQRDQDECQDDQAGHDAWGAIVIAVCGCMLWACAVYKLIN